MLLTLIMLLLLVWAAVVESLYSNFLVFFSNFEESSNYNKAYYASIWALERAELAIRYHEPWYESNAWWIDGENAWKYKNWSDSLIKSDQWDKLWFSYLTNPTKSSLFWDIKSQTSRIPSVWNWNVERILSADDSANYNTMWYEHAEIFLLYNDSAREWDNPYVANNINSTKDSSLSSDSTVINWSIRLPGKLKVPLGLLDTTHALIENGDYSQIWNDAIVDWQIRWYHLNSSSSDQFTVFSYQEKERNPNGVWSKDSAIREDSINNDVNLSFWYQKSPIDTKSDKRITIISPKFYDKPNWWEQVSERTLKDFIVNSTGSQIRLSLLNLLKSQNNLIYPFLEYYMDFWNAKVPDRYYTINAEWKYWDYQTNLIVKKPTTQESVLWNFTVIF